MLTPHLLSNIWLALKLHSLGWFQPFHMIHRCILAYVFVTHPGTVTWVFFHIMYYLQYHF